MVVKAAFTDENDGVGHTALGRAVKVSLLVVALEAVDRAVGTEVNCGLCEEVVVVLCEGEEREFV